MLTQIDTPTLQSCCQQHTDIRRGLAGSRVVGIGLKKGKKKIKRRDRKRARGKKKKKKAGRWHYLQNFHGLFLENN